MPDPFGAALKASRQLDHIKDAVSNLEDKLGEWEYAENEEEREEVKGEIEELASELPTYLDSFVAELSDG